MPDAGGLCRIVLALLPLALPIGAAATSPAAQAAAPGLFETPADAFADALRHSTGAPARADLGPDASVRLSGDLIVVPQDQAARLLVLWNLPVPPDLVALLLGPKGMDAPGIIRFVPAGFVDDATAASFAADDLQSSLGDTVARGNRARLQQHLPALEVRRWVRPPQYDPAAHQISWAALILPTTAPLGSDGTTTLNAVAFGRRGYIKLSMVTSVQDAGDAGQMFDASLSGLQFRPGAAYGDVRPGDRRAPDGLAGALGMDALHKKRTMLGAWLLDNVTAIASGFLATVGALSLLVYFRRHRYLESRRW
ncbi:DUF2167 domain-containing protein [Rhodopila globiformis]|uniref:DUF2167 domain-containing protein n=1 Tax=Rhodopila globiformis TaxID=1071 RepID=A0A2S6NKG2_RHOGL|nr:DUF2167 domain-containing protein [Rhodopila globiformis]PPQ35516.1 hypothetical protein CCS01_07495 [Rhodopila globiformis]